MMVARCESSAGLLALLGSSRSATGSCTARPKTFFQTRLAMFAAKRGLSGCVIHFANSSRSCAGDEVLMRYAGLVASALLQEMSVGFTGEAATTSEYL